MGTLILKLAGPLQSWGAESRFTERKTRHEPTKSGVVGLLASALGRRRTEHVDDLASLPMAVRIDQQGSHERDFQTARTRKFDQVSQTWLPDRSLPLSSRYYLSDALFMVGVEGPDETLATLADALEHPAFPLYLGRRACPPTAKVLYGTHPGIGLIEALRSVPWQASTRYARRAYGLSAFGQAQPDEQIRLELVRDVLPTDTGDESRDEVCDFPVSFSQEHRTYQWRTIVIDSLLVDNPHVRKQEEFRTHDPLAALGKVGG